MSHFLTNKDGDIKTLIMRYLKTKLGSGTISKDTTSHLLPGKSIFEISDIITSSCELILLNGSARFNKRYQQIFHLKEQGQEKHNIEKKCYYFHKYILAAVNVMRKNIKCPSVNWLYDICNYQQPIGFIKDLSICNEAIKRKPNCRIVLKSVGWS